MIMNYKMVFTYQALYDLWMNKQIQVKRQNLVHVKTKPTVLVDCKTSFDSTHSQ